MNPNETKTIALLGSTGSIGSSSLDVIRRHPERFRMRWLTARRNVEKLVAQVKEFSPEAVVVTDHGAYTAARRALAGRCRVLAGMEGIREAVSDPRVNLVLNALVGGMGVEPTCWALDAGKNVALANKETLVAAGALVMAKANAQGKKILPIDSEHSAIWQCLLGEELEAVRKIILTASGGPFRTWSREQIAATTPEQALRHPNWDMGAKITIDSATLMNKGLEVIEAFWLYGLAPEQIEVVVHPQSIIHSMVEFRDGSLKAQLGMPDMRIPIQFALSYPERLPLQIPAPDWVALGALTFEAPDTDRFPCLSLARQALERGGTAPAVMNAANETAVAGFLAGKIGFGEIPRIIQKTLEAHPWREEYDLEGILEVQQWALDWAAKF